jgi:hypothetical protein
MNAMQSASRSLTSSARGSIVASTGRTTLATRWEAWIPVEGELVDGAGDLREAGRSLRVERVDRARHVNNLGFGSTLRRS